MSETVTSKDGTTIVYDRSGDGPALVLVSGASCTRGTYTELAALLAKDFTVLNYDRRARGDSGETLPMAVEREYEDLAAVVEAAGGPAAALGFSSGAILALRAAAAGVPIDKLILWEPPFALDEDGPRRHHEYTTKLGKLLAERRHGDAMELFMTYVGLPPEMIAGIRQSPMWPGLEEVAPSLAYDAAAMGDNSIPTEQLADLTTPTLVLDGGASPAFLRDAAQATAKVLPNGSHGTLHGQDHNVAPGVLAPAVTQFLKG
jgi:pimeloyl-ACP methyl ester carboxylesterase